MWSTTPFLSIRRTHPNLFFAIIVFGLWGYGTAYSFLTNNLPLKLGAIHLIIGTLYFVFATCKIAGIINHRFIMISRMGMLGCMVLSAMIAVLYFAYYANGHITSLQGAFNFLALGVVQLAAMSEPSANPLTMKREKDVE
jgi:uncharacterized membrane protein YwaF